MSNIDLGTATGRLVLDASGVQSGTVAAQSALNSLNNVVRDNWWGLRNVGLAMAGIGAAAEGSLAGAVAAAASWEDSLAKIETQSYDTSKSNDANNASIQALGKQIQDLAQNTPTSISKLGQIAQAAAALGVKSEDVAGLTKTVDQLAHTTEATADVSVQALGRLSGVLGLNNKQVEQAGTVIFDLSRKTPATATQIEQLAQRLAGMGAAFGLSTPQILAMSAAVAGVAPNARTGAAAVNLVFQTMSNAVRDGGDGLARFAALTGQTTEQFKQQFQTNAAGALTSFLEGLGRVKASGQDVVGVLEGLGIKGAQQEQIILALADAQNQTANSGARLSEQLNIANQAWTSGNELQSAAQRQFQTTAAQLAELRNMITEAAQNFGSVFLPILKFVVNILDDLVVGFANLPAPVRDVLAVVLALGGALAAFGAAVFLIGPRIILVRSALQELANAYAAMQPEALAAAQAAADEAAAEEAAAAAAKAYTLELAAQRAEIQAQIAGTVGLVEAKDKATLADAQATNSARIAAAAMVEAEQAKYDAILLASEAAAGDTEATDLLAVAARAAWKAEDDLALAEARSALAADAAAKAHQNVAKAEVEQAIAADTAAKARASANTATQESTALTSEQAVASGVAGKAARDAAQGITEEGAATAAAGEEAAAGLATTTEAAGGLAEAGGGAAEAMVGVGAGIEGAGVAADATVVGGPLGLVLNVIGGIAIVGGIAAGALGLFGAAHRKAAQDAQSNVAANQQLVQVIEQQGGATGTAAKQWIIQQLAMSGALTEASKLKISVADLVAIITGTAPPNVVQGFIHAVDDAAAHGDKAAKALGDAIHALFSEFQASSQAAGEQSSALNEVGAASDSAAGAQDGLGGSLDQTKQKLEAQAQASLSLIDALLNQRAAGFAVQDAEYGVQQAEQAAAKGALDEAKASLDVQRAHLDEVKAADTLQKANEDLATARERQQEATDQAAASYETAVERLNDANQKLAAAPDQIAQSIADAQAKVVDANQKVDDSEAKLAEAMSPAPALELAAAYNKVADAELRLRDDTKTVADAQWQLNYLIQEGASGRDIQDAQDALAKARQQQVDDTNAVGQAQDDYNKKLQGDPQKVADAQRAVADAIKSQQDAIKAVAAAQDAGSKTMIDDQRAVRDATREVETSQRAYQKALDDQAQDKLYHDALIAQQEAELGVKNAALQVQSAQEQVVAAQQARAKSAYDVSKAEFGVEQALIGQAKANVEVQKEAALAKGEQFGAREEAQAMDEQLGIMASHASGPVRDDLLKMKATLDQALTSSNYQMIDGQSKLGVNPVDTGNVAKIGDAFEKQNQRVKQGQGGLLEDLKRNWDFLPAVFLGPIGIAFEVWKHFGDDIKRVGGEALDWITTNIPKIPGIIGRELSRLPEQAGKFGEEFGKLIRGAVTGVINFLTQTLPTLVGQFAEFIPRIPGIIERGLASLPGLFVRAISGIASALGTSLPGILNFFTSLPGRILRAVASVAGTLVEAGVRFIAGFIKGLTGVDIMPTIERIFGRIEGFVGGVWSNVTSIIGGAMSTIWGIISGGLSALSTVWSAVWGAISTIASTVWGVISSVISSAWGTISGILDAGLQFISGIWSTVWNAISTVASTVWNTIWGVISNAWNTISGYISGGLNTLSGIWSSIWGGISGAVSTAWNTISGLVSSGVDSVVSWITGLPGRIGNALSSLWDPLWQGFKNAYNTIAQWWNNLSLGFNWPSVDLGPLGTIGGGRFQIDTPDIPYLAEGAILNKPTLFMGGEKGDEAVVPLNAFWDRMDRLYAGLQQLVGSLSSGMQTTLGTLVTQLRPKPGGDTTDLLKELIVSMKDTHSLDLVGGRAGVITGPTVPYTVSSVNNQQTEVGGDTFNFHQVKTSARDIMREAAWERRIRARRG